MPLKLETVHKVAALARLSLTDTEAKRMQKEMDQILQHMKQLDSIDTENVEPLAHATDIADHFREDRKLDSIDRSLALSNAPQEDGEFFLVPPVFRSEN